EAKDSQSDRGLYTMKVWRNSIQQRVSDLVTGAQGIGLPSAVYSFGCNAGALHVWVLVAGAIRTFGASRPFGRNFRWFKRMGRKWIPEVHQHRVAVFAFDYSMVCKPDYSYPVAKVQT